MCITYAFRVVVDAIMRYRMLREPGTDQATNPAAIGYTDPELDTRALFGKGFSISGLPAYVNLQVAQRFRFGDPPDEFRFDATFGLFVAPKWLLLAQSFNVISEGAGRNVLFPAYDYEKLQLSVIYSVTNTLALQFGGFTTFSGRNALQDGLRMLVIGAAAGGVTYVVGKLLGVSLA